jgi:hypothetical protein
MRSAGNPNIRISSQSKTVLRTLAKRAGKSMQAVLDDAIDHYQRDRFLDDVNAAFSTLRKDAKSWKEELAERALWDKTLRDSDEKK